MLNAKLCSETETESLARLAKEYEIYNEIEVSEKKFKNMIKLDQNQSEIWFNYASFLLRQKQYFKAESVLVQSIRLDPKNEDKIFLLACLKLTRGRDKACFDIMKYPFSPLLTR